MLPTLCFLCGRRRVLARDPIFAKLSKSPPPPTRVSGLAARSVSCPFILHQLHEIGIRPLPLLCARRQNATRRRASTFRISMRSGKTAPSRQCTPAWGTRVLFGVPTSVASESRCIVCSVSLRHAATVPGKAKAPRMGAIFLASGCSWGVLPRCPAGIVANLGAPYAPVSVQKGPVGEPERRSRPRPHAYERFVLGVATMLLGLPCSGFARKASDGLRICFPRPVSADAVLGGWVRGPWCLIGWAMEPSGGCLVPSL